MGNLIIVMSVTCIFVCAIEFIIWLLLGYDHQLVSEEGRACV